MKFSSMLFLIEFGRTKSNSSRDWEYGKTFKYPTTLAKWILISLGSHNQIRKHMKICLKQSANQDHTIPIETPMSNSKQSGKKYRVAVKDFKLVQEKPSSENNPIAMPYSKRSGNKYGTAVKDFRRLQASLIKRGFDLCEKVREKLGDAGKYVEFLKQLYLYRKGVLDLTEFLNLVDDSVRADEILVNDFDDFLEQSASTFWRC